MLSQGSDQFLNLDKLPIDILLEIFQYLCPEYLSEVGQVNKALNEAAHYNLFWERKFKKHFFHIFSQIEKTSANINWYAKFLKTYNEEYAGLSKNIKKLFSLIKENDVEGLKILLPKESSIEQLENFFENSLDELLEVCDIHNWSLLTWILRTQDQILLDYFYGFILKKYSEKESIDTQKKGVDERTILHWAILFNQSEKVISELIKEKANCNALCNYKESGCTLLHLTAINNHLDLFKQLVNLFQNRNEDIHPKLNALTEDGYNVLHLATIYDSREIIAYLLTTYPELNIPTSKGETLLHLASEYGSLDLLKSLINHNNSQTFNINTLDINHHNILHFAIIFGHAEMIAYLLTTYPELSILTGENETLLHLAVIYGDLQLFKFLINLLDNQDEINRMLHTLDNNEYNVLHLATKFGNESVVKYLLATYPELNKQTNKGFTLLYLAIMSGSLDLLKFLINHNGIKDIYVNTLHDKYNLLHLATYCGHEEIVKYFLINYPELNIPTDQGAHLLHIAIDRGHDKLVNILLNFNTDVNVVFYAAGGFTALHMVAQTGNMKLFKILLSHPEININVLTDVGSTPLYCAAQCGHIEIVKALLEEGADLTPFKGTVDEVITFMQQNNLALPDTLNPINLINDNGEVVIPPATIALMMGHQEISDYIEAYVTNKKQLITPSGFSLFNQSFQESQESPPDKDFIPKPKK